MCASICQDKNSCLDLTHQLNTSAVMSLISVHSSLDVSHGLQGEGLWSRYQPGVRPSGLSMDGLSVYIDPHILSTPLIMDFDGDGSDEELVLPVNYYFEHTG